MENARKPETQNRRSRERGRVDGGREAEQIAASERIIHFPLFSDRICLISLFPVSLLIIVLFFVVVDNSMYLLFFSKSNIAIRVC